MDRELPPTKVWIVRVLDAPDSTEWWNTDPFDDLAHALKIASYWEEYAHQVMLLEAQCDWREVE